jgi:hypothetical protein
MKTIQTSAGDFVSVSDEDFAMLSKHAWHTDKEGYAATNVRSPSAKRGWTKVRMHRLVLPTASLIDHIDRNPLNNTRENLRACDHSQNQFNRGAASNNKCGLKGVSYHTKTSRWFSRIKRYGRQIHLGYFDTPEEAHEVYCLAADMLHGEFANHGEAIVKRRLAGGE